MGHFDKPYDIFDKNKVNLMVNNRDIKGLINVFREKDRDYHDMREAVSEALAEIGGDDVIDALITSLTDNNYDVQTGAVDTLRLIGNKKAVDCLMTSLRKENRVDQARWALVSIGGPYITERFIADLKDNDTEIRESAAYTLGNLNDVSAVEPLIEALKDSDSGVRLKAVEALGELKDSRAVEPLINLLKSSNDDLKYHVIESLGRHRDKRAVEILLDLFKDDKDEKIIRALGDIGDKRAIEPLIKLMFENRNMSPIIGYTLSDIETGDGVSRLIELLYDKDEDIIALSANALGYVCKTVFGREIDSRAVEPLMNLFFCNNPRVRSSVIFALGEIKDERAGDLITFAFYDEDIKVRKSAIRACAFFPDENRKIYNALMKALQNPLVGSSLRDEMFLFD